MSNKKRNKEIRKKHEFKLEVKRNPDWCWCEETLGVPADVDYDKDTVIGQTEPIDGFPHPESTNYVLDIYICKRCGKKHTVTIGY